ncbi:MAG: ankyrin repeat domain-containing protein [Epsilonproteobacteria bacterium]|nr:ankyrin repeat domain-containing protein [Campylobacterota bacterium]
MKRTSLLLVCLHSILTLWTPLLAHEDNPYPLHEAIYAYNTYWINENLAAIDQLITSNAANLDDFNDEGYAPLHIAVFENRFDVVKKLVDAGADVNRQDFFDWTPLLHAINGRNRKTANFLVEHGADINMPIKHGECALHFAIRWGIMHVEFVLEYKADINVADNAGWTPLHGAAAYKNPELVKLLLDHGADRKRTDLKKRTPQELTTDEECIKLLKTYFPENE